MAYKRGWRELPDVPRVCPVCDNGRKDAEAVKVHNLKASSDGCRSYERVRCSA